MTTAVHSASPEPTVLLAGQQMVHSGSLQELPSGAAVRCECRQCSHTAAEEELGVHSSMEAQTVHFPEEEPPSQCGGAASSRSSL